jgi:hypothetical protein
MYMNVVNVAAPTMTFTMNDVRKSLVTFENCVIVVAVITGIACIVAGILLS